MPRYYFDTDDGSFAQDMEGTECTDVEAVCREVMHSLPEIARWLIPKGDDNQSYSMLVRDETGAVVYTATLTFAGSRPDGANTGST